MSWSRTLRIDGDAAHARARIEKLAAPEGVRVRAGATAFARTYVLLEGPDSVEPAELAARFEAVWFNEAIIAIAIEPQSRDALPVLRDLANGPGAPAGILGAAIADGRALVLEYSPRTAPELVGAIVDAELRRLNASKRSTLLAPLPEAVLAAIAARGLQAPEITPERILDSLLERAHVE